MSKPRQPEFVDLDGAAFEPGGKFDSQRPHVGRAVGALVRHSGALEHNGAGGQITIDVIAGAEESNLSRDGADFLDALFWLMTLAGYSEKVRAFVCIVIATAARSEDEERRRGGLTFIKDERLGHRLGLSVRTVQRRRKAYKEEAARLRFPILHIIEGDYDGKAGQNRPTLYGSLVNDICARIVHVARDSSLWARSSRAAMRDAALKVYDDLETAPDAVRRRRRRSMTIDKEIAAIKKTIKTKLERWRDLERRKRGGVQVSQLSLWDSLKVEIETEAAAPAGATGRQIVAPSDADDDAGIVVVKDEEITSLLARLQREA